MKIKNLLKEKILSSGGDYLFDHLEKAMTELNFDDDIECSYIQSNRPRIDVQFGNSWSLVVWDNGKYSMYFNGARRIHDCSYSNLLKFMKEKKLRKDNQCDYKDAEMYIVDFENNK